MMASRRGRHAGRARSATARTVFDPAVAAHNGRIVKLIGDGTLVEFGSVVDAVNCALAIQRPGAPAPDERARPASCSGSASTSATSSSTGDDIYGDGVNVAARLEPLAEPGGVCVASIVNESVGNRIDVRFQDGGEVNVKNIDRPIRVWSWHPEATAAVRSRPNRAQAAAGKAQRPPRSRCCRSTTCRATRSRNISPTASPKTSSPTCPRSAA